MHTSYPSPPICRTNYLVYLQAEWKTLSPPRFESNFLSGHEYLPVFTLFFIWEQFANCHTKNDFIDAKGLKSLCLSLHLSAFVRAISIIGSRKLDFSVLQLSRKQPNTLRWGHKWEYNIWYKKQLACSYTSFSHVMNTWVLPVYCLIIPEVTFRARQNVLSCR